MTLKVFIRKECKNRWERRAPLTPTAVEDLVNQGLDLFVERSSVRIFPDRAYAKAGAALRDDWADAQVVLGIKEPEVASIKEGQIHLAFSHTIKGQAYNMGLLRTFIDQGATLIDYETMTDERGKRLIAFGRFAGMAGAVDSFYVAGRKLLKKSKSSMLSQIKQTHEYGSIKRLKASLEGLVPAPEDDIRVAIVGSGNVGRGCREVCRWLGLREVPAARVTAGTAPGGNWFTILTTADIVSAADGSPFDWKDYRAHGKNRYQSVFHRYLGSFNILLQTPYWEDKYPRQLTREQLETHEDLLPMVIGDISCDIGGSLACTLKETSIDEPAFTYRVRGHSPEPGISWAGPTIMAISHLPCELPLDASNHFSDILVKYLPQVARVDLGQPLESCGLSPELQRAVIVYKGRLMPAYARLKTFL